MGKINDNDFEDNSSNDLNNTIDNSNKNDLGDLKQFEEQEETVSSYSNVVYDDEKENGGSKIKYLFIRNKLLFVIFGILILLVIIFFLISGCSSRKDAVVSKVDIATEEKIYVGDKSKISASVIGTGNLRKTSYNFIVSDKTIVTIDKDELTGKSVTNTIEALASGEFTLDVVAKINKSEVTTSKSILICKKFSDKSFNLTTITLNKGQKFSLNSNVDLGVDKCYEGIKYTSSDTGVLSVDDKNMVTASKVGSATITVKNGESEQKFVINVVENVIKVKSIKLSKSSTSLVIGKSENITTIISPGDATIKDVNWTSSNEAVATVDNGTIKAIGSGSAIITATTIDGGYTATVNVTVTNGKSLSKPTTSLCLNPIYMGKELQITTVAKKTGFILSNYKQTNAGTYVVVASLVDGYTWSDGSTNDVSFKCSIKKASNTSKVTIYGTNRVNNTLTASVTSTSVGNKIYQWWYADTPTGTKTIIKKGAANTLKLLSSYLGKYIGVTVTISESTNYKASTCSDTTDIGNNSVAKVSETTNDTSKYLAPSTPTVAADDKVASEAWHIKNVTLNFSGSTISDGKGSVLYYYGTSETAMTSVGASTGVISTNTNSTGVTYYVKACNSDSLTACSSVVKYVLKLDTTKPVITHKMSGSYPNSRRVYYYCSDSESGVSAGIGWWKKSTTTTWQQQWPKAYYSYIYFDLTSAGTHNTYVRCFNKADVYTDYEQNFYVASSGTSSSSSGTTTSSQTSATITGTCTCVTDQLLPYPILSWTTSYSCASNGLKSTSDCSSFCINRSNSSYSVRYTNSTCAVS